VLDHHTNSRTVRAGRKPSEPAFYSRAPPIFFRKSIRHSPKLSIHCFSSLWSSLINKTTPCTTRIHQISPFALPSRRRADLYLPCQGGQCMETSIPQLSICSSSTARGGFEWRTTITLMLVARPCATHGSARTARSRK